jgi:hypothetical protein
MHSDTALEIKSLSYEPQETVIASEAKQSFPLVAYTDAQSTERSRRRHDSPPFGAGLRREVRLRLP